MTPASFQEQLEHLLKNLTFITSIASQKVEWKQITPEQSVERVEQEIVKARTAITRLIIESLPGKKNTEIELDEDNIGGFEDATWFCVECGQYEFEGKLNCQCRGFNSAIDTITAVIEGKQT